MTQQTTQKLPTSFEEACAMRGIPADLPTIDNPALAEYLRPVQVHYMLMVITAEINRDWVPDWNNMAEYKWYPWFVLNKDTTAGSGFAFDGCVYVNAGSYVGSRLAFKSKELAKYAATHFLDLYREYFTYQSQQ